MPDWQEILRIAIPVISGAVIGYITNWLAIKMLFRPRKAYYFFHVHVPFTPGLIPKEKARIAESLGTAVGKELLNSEILLKALTDGATKQRVEQVIDEGIQQWLNQTSTVREQLEHIIKKEQITETNQKLGESICNGIVNRFIAYRWHEKIAYQLMQSVLQPNNDNPLLKALTTLMNGKISISIEKMIADRIYDYVIHEGKTELQRFYKTESQKFLAQKVSKIVHHYEERKEQIKLYLMETYDKAMRIGIPKLLAFVQIDAIVTSRISELDVKEFEQLLLGLMKSELAAITWLGAVLGSLIGIINIFV